MAVSELCATCFLKGAFNVLEGPDFLKV